MAITSGVVESAQTEPLDPAGPEFPTLWHREAFITATERELEGAVVRGDKAQETNARATLERLSGGQRAAEKRPRKTAVVEDRG